MKEDRNSPYYSLTDGEWENYVIDTLHEELETHCVYHNEFDSAFGDQYSKIIRHPDYFLINNHIYKPVFGLVKRNRPKGKIIPVFREDEYSSRDTNLYMKYLELAMHVEKFCILVSSPYRQHRIPYAGYDEEAEICRIIESVVDEIKTNETVYHEQIDIRIMTEGTIMNGGRDEYDSIFDDMDEMTDYRYTLRAHRKPAESRPELKELGVDIKLRYTGNIPPEKKYYYTTVAFSLNKRHHYDLSLPWVSFDRISDKNRVITESILFRSFREYDYPKSLASFLSGKTPEEVMTTILPHCKKTRLYPPEADYYVIHQDPFEILEMIIHYDGKDFVII